MRSRLRRWWPGVKVVFGLAVVVAVGWRFSGDLANPRLWSRPLHLGWILLSAVLYLAGLAFSASYWIRLLGHLGYRPPLGLALRAYYLGHMGKYVPGKAWAVILRTGLIHGCGVRLGVATLTTIYEVLTTMAGGVLLSAVLFALLARAGSWLDLDDLGRLLRLEAPAGGVIGRAPAVLLSAGLFVALVVPLLPAVFNRLAHHLSVPFRDAEAVLPRLRLSYLLEGLALTAAGWLLLGASLAATLQAIVGESCGLYHPDTLGRLAAVMGLCYVIGFLSFLPGAGLGVREFFLALFLVPELKGLCQLEAAEARGTAEQGVIVLRLVWTAAEVIIVGILYWGTRGAAVAAGGPPEDGAGGPP
jgi:hypothetical protein